MLNPVTVASVIAFIVLVALSLVFFKTQPENMV